MRMQTRILVCQNVAIGDVKHPIALFFIDYSPGLEYHSMNCCQISEATRSREIFSALMGSSQWEAVDALVVIVMSASSMTMRTTCQRSQQQSQHCVRVVSYYAMPAQCMMTPLALCLRSQQLCQHVSTTMSARVNNYVITCQQLWWHFVSVVIDYIL